jgi:hypothetical protein
MDSIEAIALRRTQGENESISAVEAGFENGLVQGG